MVLRRRIRHSRQGGKAAAKKSGSPKYYRVVRAIAGLKNANGSSLKSVQRYMRTSRKATVRMMKRAIRARLVVRSRGRFKVSRLARRSRRARRTRRRRRVSRRRRRRSARRSRRGRKVAKRRRRRRGRKMRRRRRVSRRRGRRSRRRVSRRRVRRSAPRRSRR